MSPDSFATAFATSVLPQPGGPVSMMPDGRLSPNFANCFGFFIGAKIASDNCSRILSSAPISAHVTSGTVAKPSRFALKKSLQETVLSEILDSGFLQVVFGGFLADNHTLVLFVLGLF